MTGGKVKKKGKSRKLITQRRRDKGKVNNNRNGRESPIHKESRIKEDTNTRKRRENDTRKQLAAKMTLVPRGRGNARRRRRISRRRIGRDQHMTR